MVLYPTAAGVELRDLAAGTSSAIPYAGGGPGAPLTRDVDVTVSPNGARAVFPTPVGIEVIDLQAGTARHSAWLSSGAAVPLVPGIDCAVLLDSSFALYPTPTHFELASLTNNNRKSSVYAGGGIGALTQDVDAVLTHDGNFAAMPFAAGFQLYDVASNITRFVAFGGGALASVPIAVDVVFTPAGQGIYPARTGWEILDPVARTSTHVSYAGAGPVVPQPVDVNVFYSLALDKAVYPSQDGLEVLDVAARTAQRIPWAGPGAPLPLTRAVDAPLTPDGLTCLFPTLAGFEVFDLAAGTSTLVSYGGGGPHFERLRGLQEGVDVLLTGDSTRAVYPTPEGLEVLSLNTLNSTFVPWGGGELPTPLPRGVDAVLSSDGATAVYVRSEGFEVVPLPGGPSTLVPFASSGPGAAMPLAVDPIFHDDDQRVYYPVPAGFEELDLFGPPVATLIPFAGTAPGAPLPTGVDPIVPPRHGGGPPPLNMAFSNGAPGSRDFVLDDTLPDPPGTEPVILTFEFASGIGHDDRFGFPPAINVVWMGQVVTELPAGRLRDGFLTNTRLADSGWTLVRDGGPGSPPALLMGSDPHAIPGTSFSRWGDYTGVNLDTASGTSFFFDAFTSKVPQAVWYDQRPVGAAHESPAPDYLGALLPGLVGSEFEPAPAGRLGPDGATADLLTTGLTIGGPDNRSVVGAWNNNTAQWYTIYLRDVDAGYIAGEVFYFPTPDPVAHLSTYCDGVLCFAGQEKRFYTRGNDPLWVDAADFLVVNTSSENAASLDWFYAMDGASGEISLSGATSGRFTTRGESAQFQLRRAFDPANDPEDFVLSRTLSVAGHPDQVQSNPIAWSTVTPTIFVGVSGDGINDPAHDPVRNPRGLYLATGPGSSSNLVVDLLNLGSGGPNQFSATTITGIEIEDRIGGQIQMTGSPSLPVVLSSLGENARAGGFEFEFTPDSDSFGATVRFITDPPGDIPPVPLAGNASRRGLLEFSGPEVTDTGGGLTIEFDTWDNHEVSEPPPLAVTYTGGAFNLAVRRVNSSGPLTIESPDEFSGRVTGYLPPGAPTIQAGDLIPSGESRTLTINFKPPGLGSFLATDTFSYLTAVDDGAGNFINGSPEEPIQLNFLGRGVPESRLEFSIEKEPDMDTMTVRFPVKKDQIYTVDFRLGSTGFAPVRFEEPPGSGNVQRYFVADEDKLKPVVIHGLSGLRTGLVKAACHDGLRVTSVSVNDGAGQRSQLCTICVFLNLDSNLDELGAGIGQAVKVIAPGAEELPLDGRAFAYDAAQRKLTIDLTILPQRVPDGYYNVALDTTMIHLKGYPASPLLDEDGNPDGSHVISGPEHSLFALLGDSDGDRHVGSTDFLMLSRWLFVADPDKAFDFDRSGTVDDSDLEAFTDNFGSSLP